jgi:hypothetical protein
MKKYTFENNVTVAVMLGFFALGILGLYLQIGEPVGLLFVAGFIMIWIWGSMPDHKRYRNYPKKLQDRGVRR